MTEKPCQTHHQPHSPIGRLRKILEERNGTSDSFPENKNPSQTEIRPTENQAPPSNHDGPRRDTRNRHKNHNSNGTTRISNAENNDNRASAALCRPSRHSTIESPKRLKTRKTSFTKRSPKTSTVLRRLEAELRVLKLEVENLKNTSSASQSPGTERGKRKRVSFHEGSI